MSLKHENGNTVTYLTHSSRRRIKIGLLFAIAMASGCTTHSSKWHSVLAHNAEGTVQSGSRNDLVSSIRQGCQIRVAWGARRKSNPNATIEHSASPVWVSVRDNERVEVQLDHFAINLNVLGEPEEEHTNRAPYGGTQQVVNWRASINTTGQFNAVWYTPHNGKFIKRAEQRFPMRWYADCQPQPSRPLYPPLELNPL